MHIRIKLMGALRSKLPDSHGSTQLELESGATVTSALEKLGLPTGRVHLVMVNGEMEHDRARALTEGDELKLFPPVAGG
jgi:molybdopterin converting factor small subunit